MRPKTHAHGDSFFGVLSTAKVQILSKHSSFLNLCVKQYKMTILVFLNLRPTLVQSVDGFH